MSKHRKHPGTMKKPAGLGKGKTSQKTAEEYEQAQKSAPTPAPEYRQVTKNG